MKMRKIMALVLAIIMTFSLSSLAFAAEAEKTPIKGDISANGKTDNEDLVMLARSIVGMLELTDIQLAHGDMNEDGATNNADLVKIAQTIVGYSEPNESGLSEELKRNIIRDFWLVSDVKGYTSDQVLAYLGAYSGCEVVYMGGGLSALRLSTMEIGEYTFEYPTYSGYLLVYNYSTFMPLKDAYEAGWITDEDLAAIYTENCKVISELKKTGKAPYTSVEMEQRMRIDYCIYAEDTNAWVYDIGYYGTYNGCEIVFVNKNVLAIGVISRVDVNGLRFEFPSPAAALYAYKDSQFLRIDEAYEAGWITAENVQDIWNISEGWFKD